MARVVGDTSRPAADVPVADGECLGDPDSQPAEQTVPMSSPRFEAAAPPADGSGIPDESVVGG
jgi:hypothetical protein